MVNEISSKRTDLLLEYGEKQTTETTTQSRREELEKKQLDIESQQEVLKKISSTNEREIKGINLYESGRVEILDDNTAKVQSQNGQKEYIVNSKEGTCQCKDHEFRGEYGIVCIHRVAEQLERVKYNLKKQTENSKTDITSGITFATLCN